MFKHLLTSLAQLPALLHSHVISLRAIFFTSGTVSRAFLLNLETRTLKKSACARGLFLLQQKTSENNSNVTNFV